MKKILVPTDFSFLANCSVNFATKLAKLDPATIKLLHVIEPPVAKMNSTGEIMKDPMSDVYVLELVEKVKGNYRTFWKDMLIEIFP
jgi:nucleotide-binding universal stress UspA family protein